MRDVILCAFRDLQRRLFRSVTCTAGYLLGCAFITVMVFSLQHESRSKSDLINFMGTHFMAFSPAPYADDNFVKQGKMPIDTVNEAFFAEPMVVTRLLPATFAAQIAQLPEVLAATPFLLFRMKQGQDGHVFSIGGLNPDDETALKGTATSKNDIISGVFFRSQDRNVVVVEETYALMWKLQVGSVVNIADGIYPIIGIVRPGVRPVRADIFMNWPDAEKVINQRLTSPIEKEANIFLVESAGIHNHEQAMRKVEKLVPGGIINTFNCSQPAIEVMGISARGISVISMLVALMVLLFSANSQWAVVSERRHEIAVLKALGWKNSIIAGQIIIESLTQAVIGTVTGFAAGCALFYAVSGQTGNVGNMPVMSVSLNFVLLFLSFMLLAIISAGIPIFKAIKTNPAELLRSF